MDAKEKEALEIILRYVITTANEHGTPCDGMTECGKCFLCDEYREVPAAFRKLGIDIKDMPWKKGRL